MKVPFYILSFYVAFIGCLKAQDKPIKYQVNENGYSISIKPGWDNQAKALRMDHRSYTDTVEYDEYFNRGIRRGNNILVTGDKPRFALLKHLVQDKLDPDMIKLGEGMIRLKVDGKEEWLHLQKKIQVVFNPGSTEYSCTLNSYPSLHVNLQVSQAKDWGAVVKLTCQNKSDQAVKINAALLFGGIRICSRTFSASYFSSDEKEDLSDNKLIALKDAIQIASSVIPVNVSVKQIPVAEPAIDQNKVSFSQDIFLQPSGDDNIYYILDHSSDQVSIKREINAEEAENLIEESRQYYQDILNAYTIATPDKTLDAGFRTAVLNFDNIYADPAWLEGVHWWSSYWTNNYQISAAISLGQVSKARKALSFYNSAQYGPAPAFMLSGKPFVDSLRQGWEDGLPYYLYQLIQYYNHTGDNDLLKNLWPGLTNSINKFWELRDPDSNALLNWHMGANAFLYQADHLGIPGDAASPSLMMAGMMDQMSAIARMIGAGDEGKYWKSLSDKMYANLNKILWNTKSGTFHSHRDLQNILHSSHYYTDLVFPTLYTSLPDMIGWQSLDHLYRTLWSNNYKDEKSLMHVGDIKPSIFGNDNVMPVQMAEAARAYFKAGDFDKGIKLLESIALAGTVFTEAPGNFPERMNDEGKGEANYLFGNPIGSFIHATINGLFGLALSDNGKELEWTPSFPANWDHARLQLPYVKSAYKKFAKDSIVYLEYMATHDKERELEFSLFVEPCVIKGIYCNGKKVDYSLSDGQRKMKISFKGNEAIKHVVSIEYIPVEIKFIGESVFYSNANVQWKGSREVEFVYDPQKVFKKTAISKNVLKAELNDNSIGHHQVYVKIKDLPVIYPIDMEIKAPYRIHCNEGKYDATAKKIILNLTTLAPALANEGKELLHIKLLTYTKSIALWKDSSPSVVELSNVNILPEGVYKIQYYVMNDDKKIFEDTQTIHIKGTNVESASEMLLEREKNKVRLDLSLYYNTDTVYAFTEWRNGVVVFDSNYMSFVSNDSKSMLSEFRLSEKGLKMAMINYGMSDSYTRETKKSRFPESLTFPVNKKARMLSLLFINEIETRLTFSKVGELMLSYINGETEIVPLIVGKNVDALSGSFAMELKAVKMKNTDYAKIYSVPVDPEKVLQSFTIKLHAADVEIGILAANVILSK